VDTPETVLEAVRTFSDPDTCREFIVRRRWPDGVRCPREGCGSRNVHFIATRGIWRCNTCKKQFSVKVGTIFEDSPIGLDKWLVALWLLSSSKKSVSTYHLARALGITQKTAWFINHRIRRAMRTSDFSKPLSGEVEVDETFIGGKARFMHKNKRAKKIKGTGGMGKAAVMGLLERHGPDGHSTVKVKMVPNVRRRTLAPEVREHVTPGAEVFTDSLPSYSRLAAEYIHKVIDHAETYVEGKVHTNGLENFWSLFKRTVYGTHHYIAPFHLDRYLDEGTFRFNTRKIGDGTRFAQTLSNVAERRLTYKKLIGKTKDN